MAPTSYNSARSLGFIALLASILLSGCAPTATSSDNPDVDGGSSSGTPPIAATGADCPDEILTILNSAVSGFEDGSAEQIDGSEFYVPEVGEDLLTSACVVRFRYTVEDVDYITDNAFIPGGDDVASTIEANLVSNGFAVSPDSPGHYLDQTSSRSVDVTTDPSYIGATDAFDEPRVAVLGSPELAN